MKNHLFFYPILLFMLRRASLFVIVLYCLKCTKNTENINQRVLKTKNDNIMILSKWSICVSTKFRLIKKQEACGILSNLGLKTPLSKIPLLGDILF